MNMKTIRLVTRQGKDVLNELKQGKTYHASYYDKQFSSKQYKKLAEFFHMNNCPIFCLPLDYEKKFIEDEVSGSTGMGKGRKRIVLDVPENEIHTMDYYNWSDYLYWTNDDEDTELGYTQEESLEHIEDYLGDVDKDFVEYEYPQVVIDEIKPEWVVNKEILEEFEFELESGEEVELNNTFSFEPLKDYYINYRTNGDIVSSWKISGTDYGRKNFIYNFIKDLKDLYFNGYASVEAGLKGVEGAIGEDNDWRVDLFKRGMSRWHTENGFGDTTRIILFICHRKNKNCVPFSFDLPNDSKVAKVRKFLKQLELPDYNKALPAKLKEEDEEDIDLVPIHNIPVLDLLDDRHLLVDNIVGKKIFNKRNGKIGVVQMQSPSILWVTWDGNKHSSKLILAHANDMERYELINEDMEDEIDLVPIQHALPDNEKTAEKYVVREYVGDNMKEIIPEILECKSLFKEAQARTLEWKLNQAEKIVVRYHPRAVKDGNAFLGINCTNKRSHQSSWVAEALLDDESEKFVKEVLGIKDNVKEEENDILSQEVDNDNINENSEHTIINEEPYRGTPIPSTNKIGIFMSQNRADASWYGEDDLYRYQLDKDINLFICQSSYEYVNKNKLYKKYTKDDLLPYTQEDYFDDKDIDEFFSISEKSWEETTRYAYPPTDFYNGSEFTFFERICQCIMYLEFHNKYDGCKYTEEEEFDTQYQIWNTDKIKFIGRSKRVVDENINEDTSKEVVEDKEEIELNSISPFRLLDLGHVRAIEITNNEVKNLLVDASYRVDSGIINFDEPFFIFNDRSSDLKSVCYREKGTNALKSLMIVDTDKLRQAIELLQISTDELHNLLEDVEDIELSPNAKPEKGITVPPHEPSKSYGHYELTEEQTLVLCNIKDVEDKLQDYEGFYGELFRTKNRIWCDVFYYDLGDTYNPQHPDGWFTINNITEDDLSYLDIKIDEIPLIDDAEFLNEDNDDDLLRAFSLPSAKEYIEKYGVEIPDEAKERICREDDAWDDVDPDDTWILIKDNIALHQSEDGGDTKFKKTFSDDANRWEDRNEYLIIFKNEGFESIEYIYNHYVKDYFEPQMKEIDSKLKDYIGESLESGEEADIEIMKPTAVGSRLNDGEHAEYEIDLNSVVMIQDIKKDIYGERYPFDGGSYLDELIQRSEDGRYNKFILNMFSLSADELEYRIDFGKQGERTSETVCTLCMLSDWDKEANSKAYQLAVAIEDMFDLPHIAETLEDLSGNLTESNNKFYRAEIEDNFGNRSGLWTAAFDLIPTRDTIEQYPEDFEDLTPEERYRFCRFDDLLGVLSKIKSPAVSSSCVFAFTEKKYKKVKHILDEMSTLLKEMGYKLIITPLTIDNDKIKYRDRNQIAYIPEK